MRALESGVGHRAWPAVLAFGLLLGTGVAPAGTIGLADPRVEAGRRVYEQGILPDGAPLRALRPEGVILEGRHAACVTCHRPSGMGSTEGLLEGTILVPPVAGPVLFAPARFHGTYLDRSHHYVPNAAWARALSRSAYDDASLVRALREGLDPDGERLVAPMPRYDLDNDAASALAAYLRRLTAEPAPGVEPETLHLATVFTPDAPPGQSAVVLRVLRAWSETARPTGQAWRLHVWELSGGPENWAAQLEARYRAEPVFAVLSGSGGSQWGPVHAFCEAQRVPCVLPAIEVMPEVKGAFYPVYFSPGVTLEARLVGRYLREGAGPQQTVPPIVQVHSDASGRRAAEVLRSDLGGMAASVRDRRYRLTVPAAALAGVGPDEVLVLWLRSAEVMQLATTRPEGPVAERVFLSALLAPPETLSLPPAWRARVTFLSLFDDLGLQGEIARARLERWLEQRGIPRGEGLRAAADAYAACYLFAASLGEIHGQESRRPAVPLSREHLLETLEGRVSKYSDGTEQIDPDSHVALYGRMSLGPGQRVAVRGGTLLRYASPESDGLVAASDRIVP